MTIRGLVKPKSMRCIIDDDDDAGAPWSPANRRQASITGWVHSDTRLALMKNAHRCENHHFKFEASDPARRKLAQAFVSLQFKVRGASTLAAFMADMKHSDTAVVVVKHSLMLQQEVKEAERPGER